MLVIVTGGVFFSVMSLGVRLSRDVFRPDSLVFYRSLCQALVLLPWLSLYFADGGSLLKKLKAHFLRGAFGVVSMFLLYIALQNLPMGLAYLLAMTSVLWATLLVRVFLKEKLSRKQVFFGAASCLGVAIALYGSDRGGVSWSLNFVGVASALACGFTMGMALVILRSMRRSMGAPEIVFFFGATGTFLTLPCFLSGPQIPHSSFELGLLLWVGLTGTVGQFLMTVGFRYVNTMTASMCNLSQTVPTLAFGFLALGEVPPLIFFVGTALVIGGIVGLLAHGHRLATAALPDV